MKQWDGDDVGLNDRLTTLPDGSKTKRTTH